MKTIFEVTEKNRAEWLERRRNTIGASDIPTILGLNKFCSPLQLWAQKTGKVESEPETEAQFLGKTAEPLILAAYERRHSNVIVGSAQAFVEHSEIPWATATPDAWIYGYLGGKTGLIELKYLGANRAAEFEDEAIPLAYLAQVIWQLGVCGLNRGILVGLVGGLNYIEREINFDADMFHGFLHHAEQFLECVRSDVPPVANASDSKLLELLSPAVPASETVLPHDALPLFYRNELLTTQRAEKQKEFDLIDDEWRANQNELRQLLGNFETGKLEIISGGKLIAAQISQKTIKRGGYSVAPTSYTKLKIFMEEK